MNSQAKNNLIDNLKSKLGTAKYRLDCSVDQAKKEHWHSQVVELENKLRGLGVDIPINNKLTGGKVNYYLAQVQYPQREGQDPYQAECEDIIQALNMTFDEGCLFKAVWRTAAARLGNGKPGQKELYDSEKMVHYAGRVLSKAKREEQ